MDSKTNKLPAHYILDIDQWERKDIYHFYKSFTDPCFEVTADVDITGFYDDCRKKQWSFFLSALHRITQVASEIENFRYRTEGDKVICFDVLHPGSTVLYDNNTFGFCYFEYEDDPEKFITRGKRKLALQKEQKTFRPQVSNSNLIFYSVIPWVSFTGFKHARSENSNFSIPKIVIGKYYFRDKRCLLPLSVEVNHALVDGYHVGLFFQELESRLSVGQAPGR